MSNLHATYKWLNDFDCKTLTPPPCGSPYVVIRSVDENVESKDQEHAQFRSMLPFGRSECFVANILDVQQLIESDGDPEIKNVFELTLQIKAHGNYLPGDTIGILPKNAEETLGAIIAYSPTLKSQFGQKIQITMCESSMKTNPKIPGHLPTECTTLRQIFSECVDFDAIPKKAFLWALHQRNCLNNATERRFIEILVSKEASNLYTMEILKKQTTFKSLLKILRSWHFSIDNISVLLEHLPRLMPRSYSISNSLLATKSMKDFKCGWTIFKIIFSVKKPPGITTGMLERIITKYESGEKSHVNIYLRESNHFQLNGNDLCRPLIMIAIGTGLAPFIGFLEHIRERRKERTDISRPFTWLLFGCKRKNKQLSADRIQSFVADGTLSKVTVCYSRDAEHLEAKYVQDAVDESFIDLLMRKNGTDNFTRVFVCGSKQMTFDIRSSVMNGLVDNGRCNSKEDAKQILDKMLINGQYTEDIWI